jgi:hypothetical protein
MEVKQQEQQQGEKKDEVEMFKRMLDKLITRTEENIDCNKRSYEMYKDTKERLHGMYEDYRKRAVQREFYDEVGIWNRE